MKAKTLPLAMAFYHHDGFAKAWAQANRYAGEGGRIATLPDIIKARLATKPGEYPWEAYFTTLSAEYVGLSRAGKPIAIVAHGVGPLATLDGILAAYSHEVDDKTRDRRGGRVSQEEFLKLESGEYGEVAIINLEATWNRRPYQFSNHAITAKEVQEEPLWQARLGKDWKKYVERHEKFAQEWDKENGRQPYNRPCIMAMDDASNCSYSSREMFDHWLKVTPGTALAHLLSIGGLTNSSHQYYEYDYQQCENRQSLANDVSCHEWWNGTRLLAVRPDATLDNVHPGIDVYRAIRQNWQLLMKPVAKPKPIEFAVLKKISGTWFTEYSKTGESMDTGEAEFQVTAIEPVSGPRSFTTTIGGYHGFFKYGIKEVRAIAPKGANAYFLSGEPTFGGKGHIAPIKFYRIEADTTKRLVRADDLADDYEMLMKLLEKELKIS